MISFRSEAVMTPYPKASAYGDDSEIRIKHAKRWESAMKTKQADELVAVAHHEAGHAVIGRVLGLPCGSVTIIAQPETESMGHVWTAPWQELF
jgi:hypothetical protein